MKSFIFLMRSLFQEPRTIALVVGSVAMVVVVGVVAVLYLPIAPTAPIDDVPDTGSEVGAGTGLMGFMYFSALKPGVDTDRINTYAYDMEQGVVRQLTDTNFSVEFALADASHALFVKLNPAEPATPADIMVPMWFDFENNVQDILRGIPSGWNETDLAASPDGVHVALAQQSVAVDGEAADDISNWQVVIANPEQDTNVVLEAAAMPVWIDGGENLLYTKRDGIYLYNLETGLTGLMYDGYLNLSTAVELAVSPDNQYVALSLPSLNQISVLRVTNSDTVYLEEVGVIQTAGQYYRAPVFDPASQYLATVVFPEVGEQVPTVEVHSVLTGESIASFSPGMFPVTFFKLNAWETDFLADTAARSHPHD